MNAPETTPSNNVLDMTDLAGGKRVRACPIGFRKSKSKSPRYRGLCVRSRKYYSKSARRISPGYVYRYRGQRMIGGEAEVPDLDLLGGESVVADLEGGKKRTGSYKRCAKGSYKVKSGKFEGKCAKRGTFYLTPGQSRQVARRSMGNRNANFQKRATMVVVSAAKPSGRSKKTRQQRALAQLAGGEQQPTA